MLSWKPEYSIDQDGPIDRDHKMILDLCNKFWLDDINFESISNDLVYSVTEHFQHEVDLMRINQFPQTSRHIREHSRLQDLFLEVLKHKDKTQLLAGIFNFLNEELIPHIKTFDTDLAWYVREHDTLP